METARLLADLNEAQREAVASSHAPLRILAGAGSGKTRVLTRRIAHRVLSGEADPRHVLALTFTRRASGELTHRLRALGLRDSVATGTFHGIAWAQLQARWADRRVAAPTLLTSKVAVVAPLLPKGGRTDRTAALDVVTEIEWAAARLVEPEDYVRAARLARRETSVDPQVVVATYQAYREHKARKRLVDFDDLLRFWRRDLLRDPEFAAVQRWRFRHLFVDEFQDVNPAQHALLEALLAEGGDLCVVGDPNQAIYAWNGADARYLVDFDRHWPGGGSVVLRDNYRSSPQVLRAANALLASGDRRHISVAELVPHRPDGPEVTVTALPDDAAEAAAVARAVRDAHRPGGRWGRQAVLVRTNAQTALIEQALRSAGIPTRVRGGAALLERPEVKDVVASLRRQDGDLASAVVLIGDAVADARLEGPAGASPDRAAGGEGRGADEALGSDDRASNLETLARLARDYEATGGRPTARAFLGWLNEFAHAEGSDGTGDAVEVMTFHAAKGLEWPVVHIAGLEDGFVPISHARTDAQLAEERRLLYVALTRAGSELHCTWAELRTFGEREAKRRRSPFLDDIDRTRRSVRRPKRQSERRTPRSPDDRGTAARPSAVATLPRTRRRVPPQLHAGDHELYLALDGWRTLQSEKARVPPRVVASDETLLALATDRPADAGGLASVPGFGPAKARRFGPTVLQIIEEHPRAGS